MQETIHGNIQNLTSQLEHMNNALQHLALNANRAPQPQMQHQLPPATAQQQFHGYQHHHRGRGRSRGGRSNSRRGGYNPNQYQFTPNQPTFQPQPFQYPPPPQFAQGQMFPPRPPQQAFAPRPPFPLQPQPYSNQRQHNPMNPYKRYHNWNYCWTHGHDVKDNHHSSNCLNPAPGHVWHATKQNTCGGSTKGQHKIMYPSYSYLPVCKTSILSSIHNACDSNSDTNDKMVVTSNTSNRGDTHALLDSGASDHFLTVRSKVKNVRPTSNPITVTIPTGAKINSTKECDLDWPELPQAARNGHILPSLKNMALVSVTKLCDAGCEVIFRHNCCLIVYKK